MLSKEEIENNRTPKEIAKILEIEKEDKDSLIAFKESLFEKTTKENIRLKKLLEQLETENKELKTDKQRLIEKLKKEKFTIESTYSQINGDYFMAQDRLDLISEILEIMRGEK